MWTTIDLDEDVLRAVKDLAREREQSLGRVLSELARRALQPAKVLPQGGVIRVLPRKPGAQAVAAQAVKELLESDS